VYVPR